MDSGPYRRVFMCFDCAGLDVHVLNDRLVCAKCNWSMSTEAYQAMAEYANRCYYFGYIYRDMYELAYSKDNNIKIRYSLIQPSNYEELIAIAVVSGVVGNASWDVVKLAIKKIICWLRGHLVDEDKVKKLESIDIDKVMKFIDEYCNSPKSIEREVLRAVVEEEVVDEMTKEYSKYIRKDDCGNIDADSIKRIMNARRSKKEFLRNRNRALKIVAQKRNIPDALSGEMLKKII